ncbi:MAG: hypothetical protein EXR93_01825 [Gemmatimonadetes bacterium]|nr:hypothetical protein [Gemmatimonadota bacterium]
MRIRLRRLAGGLLFGGAVLLPQGLGAQSSLVPVDHPVYEWLHHQRVLGNAPSYSYENLPLTRGQIAEVMAPMHGLGAIDSILRVRYTTEFALDTAFLRHPVTLVQGRDSTIGKTIRQKILLVFSQREPHFLAWGDATTNIIVDHRWGSGYTAITDGIAKIDDSFGQSSIRAYATVDRRLGFHLEWVNPFGSQTLRYHPQWGKTRDAIAGLGSTIFAQGFASWNHRPFGFDIGTGTVRMGLGARESVILRQDSPNITWLRLRFETKVIRYTFLHGSLDAPTVEVPAPGIPGGLSSVSPARWIAVRRFELRPWPWISAAFTEALTYSNRGVDFAYLNPVFPLRLAEFDTGDKDDPIWFMDGILRPARGIELYATLGIDDMYSLADIFRLTGNRSNADLTTKLLYQAGLSAAVRTGTEVQAEYERVDPFFYTHKYPLNTFEERGFPLANDLGPNADEWWLGLKQWVPWRGWVRGSVRFVRHGLNVEDASGLIVQDVGGSITSRHLNQRIVFLAGDLHRWHGLGLQMGFEPWPGIALRLDYERRIVTLGNRIPNRSVLQGNVQFSFYPISFLFRPLGL